VTDIGKFVLYVGGVTVASVALAGIGAGVDGGAPRRSSR
jgi:hypothetical protein